MSTKSSDLPVGSIVFGPAHAPAFGGDRGCIVLATANRPEVCICAAIQMPDGYIVRGHRHDDCYITIGFYKKHGTDESRYDKGELHQAVQGFLTTGNRFVNRKEGAALMVAVGHVSAHTKQPFVGDMLFSEDLY